MSERTRKRKSRASRNPRDPWESEAPSSKERRAQMEAEISERDALTALRDDAVNAISGRISGMLPGHSVSEFGRSEIRRWLRQFSIAEILAAADIATEHLGVCPSKRQVDAAFSYIPRLCATRRMPEEAQRLRYARGILRRRLAYIDEVTVLGIMESAVCAGAAIEGIIEYAKVAQSWAAFVDRMEELSSGQI